MWQIADLLFNPIRILQCVITYGVTFSYKHCSLVPKVANFLPMGRQDPTTLLLLATHHSLHAAEECRGAANGRRPHPAVPQGWEQFPGR